MCKMIWVYLRNLCILHFVLSVILGGSPMSDGNLTDTKVLIVGEELWKETLPLKMGSRLYQLQGLKSSTWYEVKISYPASIPASFSLHLKKGNEISGFTGRKLLNTEKIIFKTDNTELENNQDGIFLMVTVQPEGVVAIRGVQERENIIYNIVCDELLMGIPRKSLLVAILVMFCLVLAFVIPCFLPSYLRQSSPDLDSAHQISSKDS